MTQTNQNIVDYRKVFAGVGMYAITWRRDGKTKKIERWINTADELADLVYGWVLRGYEIRKVAYIRE